MKSIMIVGAGGHGKVIADLIRKTNHCVAGFLDDDNRIAACLGYPVLGPISEIPEFGNETEFVMGIGDNEIRKKYAERYDVIWHTLIHPSASIGEGVSIGEGTVIMANAVVNAAAVIGRHCIINSGAIVEHDNVLEDFVHISPNAVLGGNVHIKEKVHVGIGAAVKNNVTICEESFIGAGAVVVRDISKSGTYIGVPARRILSGILK